MSELFTNEVIGPLTDAELRAAPIDVNATFTPSGTQDVNVTNASLAVTGPLTDTELRATPVPVSGTVTANAGTGFQTDALTDTQLRATPVPVSGTVNTNPANSSSSTVAQVVLPASTNTTILAANANRKKAILFIPKAAVYIKFGAVASNTSFTYKTPGADTIIEVPVWAGQIDAFGPATTINVTELV